jgi:hypothetical protein
LPERSSRPPNWGACTTCASMAAIGAADAPTHPWARAVNVCPTHMRLSER